MPDSTSFELAQRLFVLLRLLAYHVSDVKAKWMPETTVKTKTSVGVKAGVAVLVIATLGLVGYAAALISFQSPANINTQNVNTANVNQAAAPKPLTLAEAKSILGEENIIGPDKIAKVFDITIPPSEVPPIPFTKDDFLAARELNERFVLLWNRDASGNPLTMRRIHQSVQPKLDAQNKGPLLQSIEPYLAEGFFVAEAVPKPTWVFIPKQVVSGTINTPYGEGKDKIQKEIEQVGNIYPNMFQKHQVIRAPVALYVRAIDMVLSGDGFLTNERTQTSSTTNNSTTEHPTLGFKLGFPPLSILSGEESDPETGMLYERLGP